MNQEIQITGTTEVNSSISITGNTYKTSEHSVFKRLEGNRSISEKRVNKILKSIQKHGYIYNPIVINEKYEVIDGQGRLNALKKLKLPVDFVIAPGAGLEQCIALNSYGTLWTMPDYIESYCEEGNDNYIRLNVLLAMFPKISTPVKIMLITGLSAVPNSSIKSGNLKITNEMARQGKKDIEFVQDFIEILKRVKGTKVYYCYAIVFAAKCGADPNRLRETMEKADLPPAPNVRSALDTISDIYNKSLKAERRIYLHKEYEDLMCKTYGWYGKKYMNKHPSPSYEECSPK